ncbi:type II secretion system protein N [Sphingomonas sp.]|uniref:type II secretion system protein N n=1 Tax=Sphingomonas sp. TaxID=28214 RepID=UPI003D6CD95A
MRRIRLTTGPTALFGAAFVIALVAFMPMRLVLGWFGLGETGLAARSVTGSVWWGSLSGAQFGDLELGDLRAGLSPVQLLVGRARVGLDGRESDRALRGAIGVSRHSMGLDDMTATLAAGNVFAPVPVSAINLDDVSVRFKDGTCERAEGRVRATLNGDLAGIALTQSLSGTAKCDSGALLLPLASQSGTENVALRLWATGRFRAELSVQPADPAAVPKLVLSGFQPDANGYTLAIEGRF